MPRVIIIIVNWNGKEDTVNCLSSLNRLYSKGIELNVIVVDNGSSDDSVEVIKRKFSGITVHESHENLGFSGGNNKGIELAIEKSADYIWLLNNDTVVDKDSLNEFLKPFKDEAVGVAGSKIYFAPGREYHKDRYNEKEHGKVLWYAGGRIDWSNVYASHRGVDEVDNGQYDSIEETPFVTGCSMFIKSSVIEDVGKFDDSYYLYLEDLDFCLRVQRAGYKTIFVPFSKVWHVNAGSSGGPGSKLHEYYQTRNRLVLGFRYAPVRTKFALLRESLRFFIQGTPTQKKAVGDFFRGKLGNQSYEA